jgi:hypothetical protein
MKLFIGDCLWFIGAVTLWAVGLVQVLRESPRAETLGPAMRLQTCRPNNYPDAMLLYCIRQSEDCNQISHKCPEAEHLRQ